MITTLDTIVRLLFALLVMESLALVLALVAWWRVGRPIRQDRATDHLVDIVPPSLVDDDLVPVWEPARRRVFDRTGDRAVSTVVLPSMGALPAPPERSGWWHHASAPAGRRRIREDAL